MRTKTIAELIFFLSPVSSTVTNMWKACRQCLKKGRKRERLNECTRTIFSADVAIVNTTRTIIIKAAASIVPHNEEDQKEGFIYSSKCYRAQVITTATNSNAVPGIDPGVAGVLAH